MSRVEDKPAAKSEPVGRRLAKAVLRLPLAMAVRQPLRNAWWWFKGRGAVNPAMPSGVRSVLFVCLGNICRSPFAAELSKQLFADLGRPQVRCASAGIRPSQDHRSPDPACQASASYGVSLIEHRPQLLTPRLMEAHDIVVVMEWRQFEQLRVRYPQYRRRLFLLPLFDDQPRNAYERYNIADPFGRPLPAFEECYRQMARSLRGLALRASG